MFYKILFMRSGTSLISAWGFPQSAVCITLHKCYKGKVFKLKEEEDLFGPWKGFPRSTMQITLLK